MTKHRRIHPIRSVLTIAAATVLIGGGLTFDRHSSSTLQQRAYAQNRAEAATPTTLVDTTAALKGLAEDLESLVSLKDEVNANKVGIVVRSMTNDRLVYELNGSAPLTPASTTKVVTAFTALSDLGPDYVVTTDAAMANRPKDGVLVGDLYVRGHGDPNLTVSDIDQLVENILATGIKQINGNVIGDGTFFDDKYVRTEYSGDEDEVEHLPPISALSVERNSFTVIISSPRTAGQPCNVQTYPRSSGFEIVNSAVSVAPRRAPRRKSGGSRKKKRAELLAPVPQSTRFAQIDDESVERAGDEPINTYLVYNSGTETRNRPGSKSKPANPKKTTVKTTAKSKTKKKTATAKKATSTAATTKKTVRETVPDLADASASVGALRVSVTGDRDGKQTIRVSGGLLANRTSSYRYEMKNPPLVVAGIVYDRLRAHGIRISGEPKTGTSPHQVKVIGEIRRPLTEILENVLKNSNNYLAEYVFKIIGAANGGQKETAERSGEIINQRMTKANVPFSKCVINDGSGLSRANCLSAAALNAMLSAAHHDRKVFQALYPMMSIAGVDGTLRRRMKGTPAEGNVHGKTGTLRNVSALAGYATSRDGEMFVFAMLMNGGRHGAYKDVQNKIATRLAAFSYKESTSAEK